MAAVQFHKRIRLAVLVLGQQIDAALHLHHERPAPCIVAHRYENLSVCPRPRCGRFDAVLVFGLQRNGDANGFIVMQLFGKKKNV